MEQTCVPGLLWGQARGGGCDIAVRELCWPTGSAGWGRGWTPLLCPKGFKECWGAEPPNCILTLPGHFCVTDQKLK